jgi:hypothetical protein
MLSAVTWYYQSHPVQWTIFMAALVVANVLWWRAKFLLRSRGFHVSFFFWDFPDIPNMHRLISRETDPTRRRNALVLLVALYISIAFCLFLGIQFMMTPPSTT